MLKMTLKQKTAYQKKLRLQMQKRKEGKPKSEEEIILSQEGNETDHSSPKKRPKLTVDDRLENFMDNQNLVAVDEEMDENLEI